jgi:NADPH2:quinone reductase
MRAILIEKALTSVDQMTVQTVPDPVLKKGEILVDVKAAGLNFFDILQVSSFSFPPSSLSFIPFCVHVDSTIKSASTCLVY